MHDQRSCVAEDEASVDQAVLAVLLDPDGVLWSVDEVAREIEGDTTDALARLYGAGLIHRLEGFVFATRPAVRAAQLA